MPFAQPLQPVATEEEYWPAEHCPLTAVRPITAQNEPTGHGVHELKLELCWKLPAAQLVHNVDATVAYVPSRQLEHDDADDAPSTFEDFPAGQPAQLVSTEYWPAGQNAVHDVEPTAEYSPPPQPEQATEPAAAEYVLAEQLMQLLADVAE